MKPRGLLMIEHRLIERMIVLIDYEMKRIQREKTLDLPFIDILIDFIKTYADRTHHGKEEEILFRDCYKKHLSVDDRKMMDDLIEEHKYGRKMVRELVELKERQMQGDNLQIDLVIDKLEGLVNFYPKHIQKEDDFFFPESEKYFSSEELEQMLEEFLEFDQKMIHEKYQSIVEKYEP